MKVIPSDLTSFNSAMGTHKVLADAILQLYGQTLMVRFSEDEKDTKKTIFFEKTQDWLGRKEGGSDGNLYHGLTFSDEHRRNDFKVSVKLIDGQLLQRSFNDRDGKNVYNSLLRYRVDVTNLDKAENVIDTVQCPDLMIKTCAYYKY